MANSKVRCASCHNYFAPDQIYRKNGLSSWCSQECFRSRVTIKTRALERPYEQPSAPRKSRTDIPHATRLEVAQRDRCCRWCGAQRGLHMHHIVYRSQGGTHDASNLIVLCHEDHAHAHAVGPRARELLLGVIWLTYAGQRVTVPQLARRLERSNDLQIR
jgi:5-methylcytosine-specific restriction endonuclease McrA